MRHRLPLILALLRATCAPQPSQAPASPVAPSAGLPAPAAAAPIADSQQPIVDTSTLHQLLAIDTIGYRLSARRLHIVQPARCAAAPGRRRDRAG